MNNWVAKIWLPLLLTALATALYLEYGSVETFDLQSVRYEPSASLSRPVKSPSRAQAPPQTSVPKRESRLAAGQLYTSLNELVADQLAAGFVRTGYFGKFWPATVAEVVTGTNSISFVRQNGTRHNYTKFKGYKMKMVRLRSGKNETIVVFRSQRKNR